MKANYQKNRVRINKKQKEYAKLMPQDDVNKALEKYNTKQRKVTKVITRKSQKGEGERVGKSKGKRVTKKVTAPSKDPMVSGSGSGTQVLDSEG